VSLVHNNQGPFTKQNVGSSAAFRGKVKAATAPFEGKRGHSKCQSGSKKRQVTLSAETKRSRACTQIGTWVVGRLHLKRPDTVLSVVGLECLLQVVALLLRHGAPLDVDRKQ
jgi:hypothetical protein